MPSILVRSSFTESTAAKLETAWVFKPVPPISGLAPSFSEPLPPKRLRSSHPKRSPNKNAAKSHKNHGQKTLLPSHAVVFIASFNIMYRFKF